MTTAYGHDAREEYFLAQVFTAPPQKLQLMLIEAGLRNTLRARDDFRAGEFVAGGEPILKAQSIVTEIIAAARREPDNELGKRIAGLYTFVFRRLVDAMLQSATEPLDDVIRVLEEERETWRQVCEKFGDLRAEDAPAATWDESPAFTPATHAPHFAEAPTAEYETGLSFEA